MQNKSQVSTVPGISSIFWVIYRTSLDDKLEKNRLRSNLLSPLWVKLQWGSDSMVFTQEKNKLRTKLNFGHHWAFFTATKACHQQLPCGWPSALREGIDSNSHIHLDAPENGEEKTCFFSQSTFLHPFHFPTAFDFLALWINPFKHFSYVNWTFSCDHSDFSEAVHHCSQFSRA